MKILIIDDSITSIMLISGLVKVVEPKAEVFEAKDGLEGLNIFKKERPRVVFTDLTMPNMDGYEVIKAFKEIDPDVQIIVITADDQPKARELVLKLGAKRAYTKPLSPENMQNIFMNDLLI